MILICFFSVSVLAQKSNHCLKHIPKVVYKASGEAVSVASGKGVYDDSCKAASVTSPSGKTKSDADGRTANL